MFRHAYDSYMKYAFPADELMPLSCRGRFRGSEPSRGNDDDALGNFTLTLVDSLDTLALIEDVGDGGEFERAVKLVADNLHFDIDVVVSVFETNIRLVGEHLKLVVSIFNMTILVYLHCTAIPCS